MAFPILARMYNEGFRLWTSRAGGGAYEFRSAQRLSSASYVLVFHSQNLIERLRLGDAEVATALKNPMLRTVVTLDDNAPDSKMFALSTPDAVDYKPGNDAGFWLYIYSSDSLEKCRGPWPENKLLLRDAVYEDVSEEVVKTEYDAIASFMESFSQKAEESEKMADYGDSRYRNNAGYIPPERDDNVYIPLEKVNAARTVHDRAFDEVIGMIDEFVDNAAERKNAPREEKIIPKKQVAAASVPKTVEVSDAPSDISAPVLSFAQPQEKRDTAISETVAQVRPQENKPSDDDEGKEYRPKADFVFTPEARRYDIKDYFPDGQYPTAYSASAPPVASGASSVTMTATATVPQVAYYQVAPAAELSQAASRAQAVVYMSPQLLQAAQASSADKNAPIALIPVVAPETAPVSAPDAAEIAAAQPEQPVIAAPEAAEREAEAEQKQTAVTVVVRRQNAVEATKVTPVKKCTLTATVQRVTKTMMKSGEQSSRVQLQRPEREVSVPSVSIPVLAAESAPTESAPSARKHRGKAVADVPC
ncbi:MAG: hypothetical protein IJC18_01860, partial [Clostridia bacterium]|nr:hypothetical protein [Clostridia bacterium]